SVPHGYARLAALAESIAAALTGGEGGAEWEHPKEPPARLYVQCRTESPTGMGGGVMEREQMATPPPRLYILCQQGLNRSGLLTGLVLRALGVSAQDVIASIASQRGTGALSNLTFVRLIHAWPGVP